MQAIQDILVQGGETVRPILKAVVDFTCSMIPKGKANEGPINSASVSFKGHTVCDGRCLQTLFNRNWIRLAGISGALAVGFGAYGAHVLMMKAEVPEERKHSFRTANLYHFIGTFGLVAASLAKYPRISGALMVTGTTIFVGTCYYHGLSGSKTFNPVTPFGGMTLILAWISLAL